jgi:hypothetical protein
VTPSLPGARLHKLLLHLAPAVVVRDVVEPAIADLQYEAERAPTVRQRRHVIRRGHVAIVRALALSIEPGGSIRAVLILSALCALGTVLVTTAVAAHVDRRVVNSAFLAPGMVTPVILRVLGTASWRRLFAGSLLVATLTPAFVSGFGLDGRTTMWLGVARALVLLVVFAPLAAVAAIVVGATRETRPKRTMTAVLLGSAIATAAFLVARWPHGQQLSIGLAMTPFLLVLFAMVFGLTLLPLLLVARAFVARPALLAVAGLICSPAPLIAGAYIDHSTLTACVDALQRTPLSFAASSLPFVSGAIAIGWHLTGTPCPRERLPRR